MCRSETGRAAENEWCHALATELRVDRQVAVGVRPVEAQSAKYVRLLGSRTRERESSPSQPQRLVICICVDRPYLVWVNDPVVLAMASL